MWPIKNTAYMYICILTASFDSFDVSDGGARVVVVVVVFPKINAVALTEYTS